MIVQYSVVMVYSQTVQSIMAVLCQYGSAFYASQRGNVIMLHVFSLRTVLLVLCGVLSAAQTNEAKLNSNEKNELLQAKIWIRLVVPCQRRECSIVGAAMCNVCTMYVLCTLPHGDLVMSPWRGSADSSLPHDRETACRNIREGGSRLSSALLLKNDIADCHCQCTIASAIRSTKRNGRFLSIPKTSATGSWDSAVDLESE